MNTKTLPEITLDLAKEIQRHDWNEARDEGKQSFHSALEAVEDDPVARKWLLKHSYLYF